MLVTFRLQFDAHCGSFASNLKQVANLLCAQVNSASYPQRDRKWVPVVAYALKVKAYSVADWGGGVSASCKPRSQLFTDAGNGWPRSKICNDCCIANFLGLPTAPGLC